MKYRISPPPHLLHEIILNFRIKSTGTCVKDPHVWVIHIKICGGRLMWPFPHWQMNVCSSQRSWLRGDTYLREKTCVICVNVALSTRAAPACTCADPCSTWISSVFQGQSMFSAPKIGTPLPNGLFDEMSTRK